MTSALHLGRTQVDQLCASGFEVLRAPVNLPAGLRFTAPCGIKFAQVEQDFEIGAFSYVVSGYLCGVTIGRYCSFGEAVQIGRQSHPLSWVSTSPFTYLPSARVIGNLGPAKPFAQNEPWRHPEAPTKLVHTRIDNDVWIGHGAILVPGITVGTGAIVAMGSVVTKSVPPYSIVGGNPARVIRPRIPERFIEPLLATRWWEFPPAALKGLPLHDLAEAIPRLQELDPAQRTPDLPTRTLADVL